MKIVTSDKIQTLVLGIIIYMFYAVLYPFHLHYQEQYQMFLFSFDYLDSFVKMPGGLSDYIGNFIIQFYLYPFFGAFFIALLLMVMQRLVWKIADILDAQKHSLLLSFIPSVLYWGLLCNENYLIGGVVSLVFLLLFILLYLIQSKPKIRTIIVLLSVPILYWIAGGVVLFYGLFLLIYHLVYNKLGKAGIFVELIAAWAGIVIMPFVAKAIVVQYPLIKFIIGVNYYSFPNIIPVWVASIAMVMIVVPFLMRSLPQNEILKTQRSKVVQWLLIVAFAWMYLYSNVDFSKEEVMAYDFYTRIRKWDKVVAMADKKSPSSPLSVACLNLALAKKGLLAENMFKYYQNGVSGLLPDFKKDFTIPMVAGEVYYQLGFINTAQRYTFEAMEALPLYQKSVRTIKRLAETNLINENYELTAKYLKLLQQTLFYKKWATALLNVMTDKEVIDHHPEYGWLKKHQLKEDFFFSENEKDMMLGLMFTANNKNRMVYEYLMAYCLLNKDLNHFMKYVSIGNSVGYKKMPKSFQEGFVYSYKSLGSGAQLPSYISKNISNDADKFLSIVKQSNGERLARSEFKDTYWYYLHYRN